MRRRPKGWRTLDMMAQELKLHFRLGLTKWFKITLLPASSSILL